MGAVALFLILQLVYCKCIYSSKHHQEGTFCLEMQKGGFQQVFIILSVGSFLVFKNGACQVHSHFHRFKMKNERCFLPRKYNIYHLYAFVTWCTLSDCKDQLQCTDS